MDETRVDDHDGAEVSGGTSRDLLGLDAPSIIDSLVLPPSACMYLPQETAQLQVRHLQQINSPDYDALLQQGWRRQGISFFRPVCQTCRECRSLRLPVADFKPSKSQRRTLKRNSDVEVEIGKPACTRRHIEIFNAYHEDMQRRRGWDFKPIEALDYMMVFLSGSFEFAREFRFYRSSNLAGVGLVDVTSTASSSIYFYHDPAWRSLAPGVFSVLVELQHAVRAGLTYHYMGYWISGNPSMSYKSQYRPHELLSDTIVDEQSAAWFAP